MKTYSKIKILGSGSDGNCILVYDNEGKCIVLDAGLPWNDILKGLSYDLDCVVCVLVNHIHKDHSLSVNRFLEYGIPVYGNEEICGHYKGCMPIGIDKMLCKSGYRIQTFPLVHNVENNAFIIDTADRIRVLYAVDTKYIPKIVKGVHVAIVECNFDDEVIIDNFCDSIDIRSQYQNHHSLECCTEYLHRLPKDNLQQVILAHMSKTNLDKKKAVTTIKEEIGLTNVFLAEKNSIFALDLYNF